LMAARFNGVPWTRCVGTTGCAGCDCSRMLRRRGRGQDEPTATRRGGYETAAAAMPLRTRQARRPTVAGRPHRGSVHPAIQRWSRTPRARGRVRAVMIVEVASAGREGRAGHLKTAGVPRFGVAYRFGLADAGLPGNRRTPLSCYMSVARRLLHVFLALLRVVSSRAVAPGWGPARALETRDQRL
jgi:hypothetical protein